MPIDENTPEVRLMAEMIAELERWFEDDDKGAQQNLRAHMRGWLENWQ